MGMILLLGPGDMIELMGFFDEHVSLCKHP